MDQKRFWILLAVLHALFMGKQLFFGNSLLQDSREYLYAADNLLQHQTLYAWNMNHAWNPDWLSKRPFVYPLILSLFRLISLGSDFLFFFLIYGVQNLISMLNTRLVLKIAAAKGLHIRWSAAAVFMLFSVSQLIYANMLMSEVWLQLCMVSVLYLAVVKPDTNRRLFYIALLLICGMALKPVLQFCAILLPLIWLIRHVRRFRFLGFATALLPLLFYMSVSAWNQSRTGYFHYSSISNINLLHYNTYSTLMYRYGTVKADSIIDNIHTRAQIMPQYKDEQIYIRKASTEQLMAHLPTYVFLHARGIVFCLLDPGRFDFTQFFDLPHGKNLIYETNKTGAVKSVLNSFMNPLGALLALLMVFNAARAICILRFVFSRGQPWLFRLLLLAFPLYILALTGPIGTSRFFMPLIPFALLMCIAVAQKKRLKNQEPE